MGRRYLDKVGYSERLSLTQPSLAGRGLGACAATAPGHCYTQPAISTRNETAPPCQQGGWGIYFYFATLKDAGVLDSGLRRNDGGVWRLSVCWGIPAFAGMTGCRIELAEILAGAE